MRVRLITVAAMLAAFSFAGPASAQLKQPRCGGWPSGEGNPGIIIGSAGTPCYGLYFDRPRRHHVYGETKLRVGPRQGRFRILNETEFEYTPAASVRGWDRIVVELTVNGAKAEREFRATTDTEFRKLGGTDTAPPPGMAVNRWGN